MAMRFDHLSALIILAVIASAPAAIAGAPEVNPEICTHSMGEDDLGVGRDDDFNQPLFASVRRLSKAEHEEAKQRGMSEYEIVVNPERYFIGNWTQQWLYLRQCAHINLAHPIRDEGDKGFNFDDEESADCWAVNRLREDPLEQGFSDRALRDIERDIAYVVKKGLWRELLPGPERPVDLMACKND